MKAAPKRALLPTVVLVLGSLATQSLQASTIHHLNIFTDNGGYADGAGLLLTLEVSELGSFTLFKLTNDSTVSCAVSGVYFERASLTLFDLMVEGPGTSLSWPASPGHLPSGDTLTPRFDTWFSIGADSPQPVNGINPGESVVFHFQTANGIPGDDVGATLLTGEVRVGAHVIAFPDGSSESAVSSPEPGTLTLLAAGALLLRRRRAPNGL